MFDLTPDRSGVIPSEYALRYKELGDFIRSCYGNPIIPSFQNSSIDFLLHIQMFKSTVSVDCSVIQEDQTNGQVIRGYTVDALVAISKDKNECVQVASGTSIGNKKIDLWSTGPLLIRAGRLSKDETIVVTSLELFL